ncbi:major facilitator superfamily domain-containing protein [Bisporella sp. PMI_857]|nr:major facilitator superfamily domain-containing protein [Bisporella sp. PMI_857]
MAKKSTSGPKLPVQQLAILAICRFAEPLSMTSVYPYLPELIESFGIGKKEVARWAGITSAAFSLAQCLTAILWGRASDKFGRKPMIMAGLTMTMVTSILFGLSSSIPMAITVRALAGACNGNVGIIRTMVAEMVPEKELQPRAFSIMPLIWSLGSIFGPSLGGFFASPAKNLPNLFGHSWLLIKYPYLLPNIVTSCFFIIGISTGILFLKETLETRRDKTDYGRVLGSRLVDFLKTFFHKSYQLFKQDSASGESSPLLRPSTASSASIPKEDDASRTSHPTQPRHPRPALMEVFTRQSVINLTAYTLLALHCVAYDQLLPIFLHYPRQMHTPHNTSLPFKFSGGFGLDVKRIGSIFSIYGIVGCFIQFVIFPPTARKFGVLNCFKVTAIAMPIIYFLTPYLALIEDEQKQQMTLMVLMVARSFCVIFAFPCSIIMLTNSAVSLRILGTLNGVATSVSAVGRAAGPGVGGLAMTWGLEQGYIITPYYLLCAIAILGAIPLWFLVEMEGFSKSGDESEDDDDEQSGLCHSETTNEENGTTYGSTNTIDRKKHADHGKDDLAELERKISNPIGIPGGSVGPGGGHKLSNALAASNMGQGTGGTSFT